MASRIYDGAAWKNVNGLKLFNGTTWKNAVRGWTWNGTAWKQWYPEYPINTAAPTVSGTATQGNTLSVTNGSWNSNLAYAPVSYSYQWRRGSSDISGATNSTYSTVVADVGNAISCRVTATNNRGTTPVLSSNSITVTSAIPGAPTGLSLTNNMATPNAPSSITVSNLTQTSFNVSFGAASGTFQAYEVLTSNSNHVVSNLNQVSRTATVTGGAAGESFFVGAFATNTSGSISMSWTAGSNATSYDIYNGTTFIANVGSTSYTYNPGSVGTFNMRVFSRNSAGAETTGVSNSITLSKVYSSGASTSGNFVGIIPSFTSNPTASSITTSSATISWGSTNQATYSISGVGGYSGGTGTSVNVTGLSPSTQYTATVTIASSTNNTDSRTVTFTTAAVVVTPTINSLFITTSDTAQTLITVNWSSTNQSSWSISASPATGGASGGSSFSGTTQTSKYVGVGVAGTTYTFTLTITSSSGHTTSQQVNHTPPASGTAPSTPTGLSNTYSTGPSWTGSWNASTGTTPITYFWTLYQSQTNGGTVTATASGSTTGTSFTRSMSSANGLWAYFTVYAQNSIGTSGTATSGWA